MGPGAIFSGPGQFIEARGNLLGPVVGGYGSPFALGFAPPIGEEWDKGVVNGGNVSACVRGHVSFWIYANHYQLATTNQQH